MTILVVGSVAYDTIKTPTKTVERALGGSAVFFSTVASYFTRVQLVGVAGDDFSTTDLEWLQGRGVDTSGLEITRGKTFHWSGEYNSHLTNPKTHATELNVFESFNPVLPQDFRTPDFLFLANIDPRLQSKILDQVERPRLVVADTMNFWIQTRINDLFAVLKRVDILILNESEARELSQKNKVVACGEHLLTLGPKRVIIKCGEYGAMLFSRHPGRATEIFSAPAYPTTRVVDPTGAGDSFAGGFLGYLAACQSQEEEAFRQGVVYGGVMASLTVEDFSIHRYKNLDPQEIQKRVEMCYSLARFTLPPNPTAKANAAGR